MISSMNSSCAPNAGASTSCGYSARINVFASSRVAMAPGWTLTTGTLSIISCARRTTSSINRRSRKWPAISPSVASAKPRTAEPRTAATHHEQHQPRARRRGALGGICPLHDVEDKDLGRELDRATAVQAHMLQEPPTIPGFDIARVFQPHAAVSGDAYDLHLDEQGTLHFVVADVAGHGLQGAIISAGLMRSIRLLRRSISDPKELLIALNAELKPELLPGQFVTVCRYP